jgi:hypothetical protein
MYNFVGGSSPERVPAVAALKFRVRKKANWLLSEREPIRVNVPLFRSRLLKSKSSRDYQKPGKTLEERALSVLMRHG